MTKMRVDYENVPDHWIKGHHSGCDTLCDNSWVVGYLITPLTLVCCKIASFLKCMYFLTYL